MRILSFVRPVHVGSHERCEIVCHAGCDRAANGWRHCRGEGVGGQRVGFGGKARRNEASREVG
jgi:hypothetical protein